MSGLDPVAVQFALPGQTARYVLRGVYGVIALAALIRNRRPILAAVPPRARIGRGGTAAADLSRVSEAQPLAALVLTSPLTPLGKKPPEVTALGVR